MLAIALAGTCLSAAAERGAVRVVASFSILGDMVREVAGDVAGVSVIVGPDSDAHVYQPSVSDARSVVEADIVFVNGLGFETWADALIAEAGGRAIVVVASDGIEPLIVNGAPDPHAWNSLPNGLVYVQNITRALVAIAPEHAAEILANAESYSARINALDDDIRASVGVLPAARRTVVTAHDAFGYLAREYDLTFLAPKGIDTEGEPSARDLAVLIRQLKRQQVAALFVENITSPDLVQQISMETGIDIGGRLFSDALSVRGGPATSYLAMFRHNFSALLDALGAECEIDEAGAC